MRYHLGVSSNLPKPPEILHRRKLFGGQVTAEELHRKVAWRGKKCDRCGGPPAEHARIFWPLSEIQRRPVLAELYVLGKLHTVRFKDGPYVRTDDLYACERCRYRLRITLARSVPSWAVVDWDRGPGPDKPIIQVK